MSGSSRSRQKRKLEPISIEELAGTTGMSGFCSFLTRDASVSIPVLDALESSAPETEPSESGAPVSCALEPAPMEISAPQSTAPHSSASESSAIETSAPETSQVAHPRLSSASEMSALHSDALEYPALDYSAQRRPRIRETSTVQDGHSLAEQAVYDVMYRAGKTYQGESRILTIGLRTLAEMSRMAYSNCKANVRSLVEKLAIDEREGFSYTQGRTYVVYSFREILRRRKAAGLTHVIRSRGVAFVDPATGIPLRRRGLSESSALDSTASISSAPGPPASAPEQVQSTALPSRESSALAASAPIENRHLLRNSEEPSSSALEALVSALRSHTPDTDDDAAISLWHRCRENAPAASPAEIVHFIHLKAGKPGIRMPLGFLLTAVPKCFQGDSYRQFLEERRRNQAAQSARDRMFAEEILRSSDADDEQREWAREVLSLTASPQ